MDENCKSLKYSCVITGYVRVDIRSVATSLNLDTQGYFKETHFVSLLYYRYRTASCNICKFFNALCTKMQSPIGNYKPCVCT